MTVEDDRFERNNVIPIKPLASYSGPEWQVTDEAMLIEFEKRHGRELVYVPVWDRWLIWRDGVWAEDERLEVQHMARLLVHDIGNERRKRKERVKIESGQMMRTLELRARSSPLMSRTSDDFDINGMLLNTPGGIVNLEDGEMLQHRREDYCSKQTAVAPVSFLHCPRWFTFLHQITGGDEELIGFLQRMCGYALTGRTDEQALFFLYGTGANGKSVFLNTVADILGNYARAAATDTFMVNKYEQHSEALAVLRAARLVIAIETERNRQWSEGRIKMMTGGDRVRARYLYQDSFEFTPQCKIIIASNHKPDLHGVDEAIRRRLYIIPFTVTIPKPDRDNDLKEKLKPEWPSILGWMLEGCLAWQTDGLRPPASVMSATEEYLQSEDMISMWIEECCTLDMQAFTASSTLYASWRHWAEQRGEQFGSLRQFVQALKGRSELTEMHKRNQRGFRGIKIATDDNGGWVRF